MSFLYLVRSLLSLLVIGIATIYYITQKKQIVKTFSFLSIYDLRQTLLFYWNHLAL